MKARWVLEGAGAALLVLLPDFCPLLLPLNISLYHHRLPVTHMVAGLLLDLAGTALLGTVLIVLLSRLPALARRMIGASLAALVCWRAAGILSRVFDLWNSNLGMARNVNPRGFEWAISHLWSISARFSAYALVLLFAVLAWFVPPISTRVVKAVRFGLASISFSLLWIVPSLAAIAMAQPPGVGLARASAHPRLRQGRIVWILFDELSYDLLFDHHPAGLQTPNFERLYVTSISLGNLKPAGYYTDRVIPSLLAGYRINRIASTSQGKLEYFDEQDRRWKTYDPQHTLFARAQTEGWNPGVAGWYIPYCRTFGQVLSRCFWLPGVQADLPLEQNGASEEESAFADALILPEAPMERLVSDSSGRARLLKQNIRDYLQIMKNASELIDSEDVRLVFLHMPVPHPPGFFDRGTHRLSASGNYLDNLVLADDTLGVLRREIARTPDGGETTLIVSSDHSWRVPLWRASSNWTAEEERVSHGRYDPRPVFLVHFPGQKNGADIVGPASELIEHTIVARMLTGAIRSPDDVRRQLLNSVQTAGLARRPDVGKASHWDGDEHLR